MGSHSPPGQAGRASGRHQASSTNRLSRCEARLCAPRYDGHRGQWLPASIWQVLSQVRSQAGCDWIWNEYENTSWGRGEPGYLLIERDIEETKEKERREAFLAGLNVLMERLRP